MVDFPHPETPITITTAGLGGEASLVGRSHGASIRSLRRSGAIHKPMQTPNRANRRCGKHPISRLGAGDDVPLFSSCHDERDIAAAVERRIGQRDARLGLCANDGDRPPPRLFQRRLTGEQRGRVPVISDPKQRDVEQRPVGTNVSAP